MSDIQINTTNEISSSGTQANAMSEVLAMVKLAAMNPRSEEKAVAKVLASLDRYAMADRAYYSFPRGKRLDEKTNKWVTNIVEGPSVYLTREVLRLWGNNKSGCKIIMDTEESRTIEGSCWDLETNTFKYEQSTFGKLVQKKNGWVKPDERELRELTNRLGAICTRNASLQILPRDLIDSFFEKAKKVVASNVDVKNIVTERANTLNTFETTFGINQENLEVFLGVDVDSWIAEDIATLRGLYRSIKDGQVKTNEIKDMKKKEKPIEGDLKGLLNNMKVVDNV